MRATRSGLVFGLALALALVACDGDDGNDEGSAATACEAAFADAAAISDMEDTVEDLDPAVRACSTLAEWSAAAGAHPDALDGVDPETFLSNRCLYGESLSGTDLCQSLD